MFSEIKVGSVHLFKRIAWSFIVGTLIAQADAWAREGLRYFYSFFNIFNVFAMSSSIPFVSVVSPCWNGSL